MNPADPQGQNGNNGSNLGSDSQGGGNNFGSGGTDQSSSGMGGSMGGSDLGGGSLGGSDLGGSNLGGESLSSGMEPSTPAMGASSSVADSAAGGNFGAASGNQGAMSKVKDEAFKLRSQATDRARSAAEDGKIRATEKLDGFARSIHDVAGNLEEQVGPQLAQYAHRAADALDEFSANLRNKEVDELVDDAREFVRRSPAIAIGAAVALGFALSRFLKATSNDGMRAPRNSYSIDDDDDDMPSLITDRGVDSQPRYNA